MISGAHVMIFSKDTEADYAFFRDVLKFPHVDAGGGFLIFALPPSEMAVHEAPESAGHEVSLICEEVESFAADMARRRIPCTPVENTGWGLSVHIDLPGGSRLRVYQARYRRPNG